MPLTYKELGKRLKSARRACGMTQEEVAQYLGVSRSTIAQMETGRRAVTSLELSKLAAIYGRDIRDFLEESVSEEDAISVLFRAHPEIEKEETVKESLQKLVALGRELANLEELLNVEKNITAYPRYSLPIPETKWEAIRQGERVAEEERRRLGLGVAPLDNVADILEAEGIRTAALEMSDEISGITLKKPDIGVFVVVNVRHSFYRRRFSYAHEYAHVLLDGDRVGIVSKSDDKDNLIEVRANAFAAAFLMPEEGVREYISGLGKIGKSRQKVAVYDEEYIVEVEKRMKARDLEIQIYDVVWLAHHFGVSRASALFRLRNLGFISEEDFERLREQEESGAGNQIASLFSIQESESRKVCNDFYLRILSLGLEAYRRGEITFSKLRELAEMVEVGRKELEELLEKMGLKEEGSHNVILPEKYEMEEQNED